MREFKLPKSIATLIVARNGVREYYRDILKERGSAIALKFTLDGNLVGDIGEAIAVELFGVKLVETAATEGIDGYAPNGETVQIKATGTGRGPAFRLTETRADHLLFFDLNFEDACGVVVFNGPEHYATSRLPKQFTGQRSLSAKQIRDADLSVRPEERLPRLDA